MAAPTIDLANIAVGGSGTGGALALPLPGGTADPLHLYVATFSWGNQSLVFTPPSGFTQVRVATGTSPSRWIGYSIGTPANVGANLSSGGRWAWECLRILGADTEVGPPIDASAIDAAGSVVTTTISDPGLTTTDAERLILHFYSVYTDDLTGATQVWTPGAEVAQVVTNRSPSATARNMQTLITSEVAAGASAVPSRSVGITLPGDSLDATLAIAPAAVSAAVAGDVTIERF